MHVDNAIESRKSVRRFLPDAVSKETVEHILNLASRAPSGANMQPWRVHVVANDIRDALCADIYRTAEQPEGEYRAEFDYYPSEWFEPYLGRRRRMGFSLYEKAGIRKDDEEGRQRQLLRNFLFFDAPVSILVSMDRRLGVGGYLAIGAFIQNVTLAARGQGLHTCVQNSIADFHEVVRRHVPIDAGDVVICGIALGREDTTAGENALRTERAGVGEFAVFHGFDGGPEQAMSAGDVRHAEAVAVNN